MILIDRPEYTFRGEFLWFGVILHHEVHVPYTKTVKRLVVQDLHLISASISQPIYVFQAPSHDPKKRKYILSLGFTLSHRLLTEDGEWAEIFSFNPIEVRSLRLP